jgi:hypothetical protein
MKIKFPVCFILRAGIILQTWKRICCGIVQIYIMFFELTIVITSVEMLTVTIWPCQWLLEIAHVVQQKMWIRRFRNWWIFRISIEMELVHQDWSIRWINMFGLWRHSFNRFVPMINPLLILWVGVLFFPVVLHGLIVCKIYVDFWLKV